MCLAIILGYFHNNFFFRMPGFDITSIAVIIYTQCGCDCECMQQNIACSIYCCRIDSGVAMEARNRLYSCCQSLKPSLVFLNRASYGRRRNNDITSQQREVTMMLRHNLRTDAHICGKSASQASLFVRHGRGVNRVYCS